MELEVFFYTWTAWDIETDSDLTRRSQAKVTREFIEERGKEHPFVRYQVIEDSKELVDSSSVMNGKLIPSLQQGFQRRVK